MIFGLFLPFKTHSIRCNTSATIDTLPIATYRVKSDSSFWLCVVQNGAKQILIFKGAIMMKYSIQCQCGTVCGELDGAGVHNRLICYCTDCRAYANFLGRGADVLDEQGGTEIVQVAQPRVRFLKGEDKISALRLSEKGMIRWYASCCNTPIGNTLSDPKVSFIGLIHVALEHNQMDQHFGKNVAILNADTALGEPKPAQRGLLGVMARFIWVVVTARISGRYKNSPLFDASGVPRVVPSILRPEELARLK